MQPLFLSCKMIFVVLIVAAFVASGLTFFSGFGLNTLLMPVFAIFFPVDTAIALTAIVHILNNLFKLGLVGKHTQWRIVGIFGFPAMIMAFLGAYLLHQLGTTQDLYVYTLQERNHYVTITKIIIAVLMLVFAAMEGISSLKDKTLPTKYLPLGGILSGFFGGLSGHQGALRSMFLIRLQLPKEAYIATGVMTACMIDVTRLAVYTPSFVQMNLKSYLPLLICAILGAFAGAWVGNRYLKKITYQTIQKIVSVMLVVLALLLGSGIL